MKNYSFVLIIIILFGFLSLLQAEDVENNPSSSGIQSRKVCILDAINISENTAEITDDQVFKTYFKENLNLEVKNAGYNIIEDAVWKQKQAQLKYSDVDLIEGPKAVEVAGAAGADIVISQFYYIDNNRITFGIKCYDVKTKILIIQSIKEGRAGLSISTVINEVVAEVIPYLSQVTQPVATVGIDIEKETIVEEIVKIPVIKEKGEKVTVVLKSPDNGAEIFLADEKIGTINDEQFSLEIQANSKLLFDVKKEGFHSEHYGLTIGGINQEIPLKRLMKITDWGLKLEYSWFQFSGAGIGARIYFIPDVLGLDILDYPYLQFSTLANRTLVLHNDTNFTFLLYPFIKPSAFYRFNLVLGMGVISTFIFRAGLPVYFDFYADFGMTIAELNFPDFLVYFKTNGRYFFDIFHTGLLGTRETPPFGVQFTYGVLLK